MRRLQNLLAITCVMLLAATANAQLSATTSATSTANIVAPITLSKVTDLSFGNIAASGSIAGTVELTPANNRIASGGATLPVVSGTVSAATFTATGLSGYTYAIMLPVDITLVHSLGLDVMLADNLVSTPSGSGTLTGGSESIAVGATLNIEAGQMSGFYSGTFDVSVAYN
jgi:hypothetical protein